MSPRVYRSYEERDWVGDSGNGSTSVSAGKEMGAPGAKKASGEDGKELWIAGNTIIGKKKAEKKPTRGGGA